MKVKELIKVCEELDPETEVVVPCYDDYKDLSEAAYYMVSAVKESCGYFRYAMSKDKKPIQVLKIW